VNIFDNKNHYRLPDKINRYLIKPVRTILANFLIGKRAAKHIGAKFAPIWAEKLGRLVEGVDNFVEKLQRIMLFAQIYQLVIDKSDIDYILVFQEEYEN